MSALGRAQMALNDHLGQKVAVTVKAAGDIQVLQMHGVLRHITPAEQAQDFREWAEREAETVPEGGLIPVAPDEDEFERDIGVYSVGDGTNGFDLTDVHDSDFIEVNEYAVAFPLDEAATLEVMFLDAVAATMREDDDER
jgi:hypothetical protein